MPDAHIEQVAESTASLGLATEQPEATVNPPGTNGSNGRSAAGAEIDADDATLSIQRTGSMFQIPASAFKALKERERARGQREAQKLLEAKLIEGSGFGSLEELMTAIHGLNDGDEGKEATMPATNDKRPERATTRTEVRRPQPPADRRQPPAADDSLPAGLTPHMRARIRKEREASRLMIDKLRRKAATEEKRRKVLEQNAEEMKVEMAMRELAVQNGVKDPDYALELVRRELRTKSDEDLKAFKPEDYFGKLRGDRPYLFGEHVVPAHTGAGSNGGAPPAPRPGAATQASAQAEQIDARKMTPAEFKDHLRKRGYVTNFTV